MNELVVSLVILLFPGVISTIIADKITVHTKWTPFKFTLYSMIMGVFAYFLLQLLYWAGNIISAAPTFTNLEFPEITAWKALLQGGKLEDPREVVYATALAPPTAIIFAAVINRKYINKLAQSIKVTNKYGDENLFSFFLGTKQVDWVYLRDVTTKLTYHGRVEALSENEHLQEIVLINVTVYTSDTSELLYHVPSVYISRQPGMITIETEPPDSWKQNSGDEQ